MKVAIPNLSKVKEWALGHRSHFLFGLLGALAVVGGQWGIDQISWWFKTREATAEVAAKESRIAVTATKVEKRDVIRRFFAQGHLRALKEVQVSSDSRVTVTNLFITWGQKVKKGQPLFEVDSRLHQLRGRLRDMEHDAQKRELAIVAKLAQNEIISKNEFAQKQRELDSLGLRSEISKLESGAGRVLSPIDGVIAEIKLKPGDYVDDTQKFYVKVVDSSELRFETWLPADVAHKIRAKDEVIFEWKRPATHAGEENELEVETGYVEGISPIIDAQSGTVMVTVSIKDLFNQWLPGTYVQAGFVLEKAEAALAIRNESILYDKGEPYTYRVTTTTDGLGKADRIALQLGVSDGEYTTVVGALSPSEKVIGRGIASVTEETPVEIVGND